MSTTGFRKLLRIAACSLTTTAAVLLNTARGDAQDARDSQPTASVAIPWPNDGGAAIVRVLNQPAKLDYDKTPLEDVAADIGKRHQILVQLDRRALDDAAIGSETPVTCSLQGAPLKTALELALRQFGLTYVVDNEVLLITTNEAAESKVDARAYPVRDLITQSDGAGGTFDDPDGLIETINTCVAPETWEDAGGPGALDVYKGVLVVDQSWHGHELVARLLSDLREARRNKQSVEPIGNRPAQVKLLKALRRPVRLNFKDTPLNEALASVAKQQGIPLDLDRKALDDAAIGSATPISVEIADAPLGAALSVLLHDVRLRWLPWDGALVVTTPEVGDTFLPTLLYPVADLATRQDEFGGVSEDFDAVAELMKQNCSAETWQDAGGPGSLDIYSGALVVSQTFEVHQQIAGTLAALRQARQAQEKPATAPVSIRAGDPKPPERLVLALRKRVTLNAKQMPLNQALAELTRQTGAAFAVDRHGLEDAAIGPDTPCTIQIKGATLQSVLELMLREVGLTFIFQHEALWITTREVADTQITTRVFPVRDLITYSDSDGLYLDAAPLHELIHSTVAPESWENAGGPGSLGALVGGCDALVCSQTEAVHQAIEKTLSTMRKVIASQQPPAAENVGKQPILKVYRLTGAAPGSGPPTGERDGRPSEEQLSQLIRDLIEPKSWDKKQGAFVRSVKGALAVRNTPQVQSQVGRLLEKLHEWSPRGKIYGVIGTGQGAFKPVGQIAPLIAHAEAPRDTLAQFGGGNGTFGGGMMGWNNDPALRVRIKPPGYNESVQLEVYHLAPDIIVKEGEETKTVTPAADKVASLVEASVEATTWQSAGGEGFIRGLPGVIVVRQKGAIQRQVAKLLFDLMVWDPRGVRIDNAAPNNGMDGMQGMGGMGGMQGMAPPGGMFRVPPGWSSRTSVIRP